MVSVSSHARLSMSLKWEAGAEGQSNYESFSGGEIHYSRTKMIIVSSKLLMIYSTFTS